MADPGRLLFYWPPAGEEVEVPVEVKGVRRAAARISTGVAFTLDRVFRTLRSLAGLP